MVVRPQYITQGTGLPPVLYLIKPFTFIISMQMIENLENPHNLDAKSTRHKDSIENTGPVQIHIYINIFRYKSRNR